MFLVLDDVNIINKALRGFLGDVDWLVYTIISWILEGIFNLSQLMTNNVLASILYKRVYVVLAIFMVFKLTISFIQYLVSPDKMTDKETGVGKLIGRTVLMLAMLIILPIIFFEPMPGRDEKTILNVLQSGVIQTLPKIILGVAPDDSSNTVSMNSSDMGKSLAVSMLQSFYFPARCDTESLAYDGQPCEIEETELKNLNDFIKSIHEKADKNGVYKYEYMWPISTIAGILLVVILLGFAVDIAIRVFKLLLLQMVAPIPVMSYIDPKSSKDGAFASWLKTFTSTFVEIFLKLGVIYILLLLISKLFSDSEDSIFGSQINNINGFMARNFVRVFLVIGLFKFAKDAPKFIKDALGIKDKGGGGGGMMGKMASGLAGAAAGFAGGGLAGAVTGAKAGYAASGTGKPSNAFASARDAKAKALGKVEGGIAGRLNQRGLQKTVARKTGLTANTLDAAKNNYLDAQGEADRLKAAFDRGDPGVTWNQVADAQLEAATAQSNYEKAKKVGDAIGLGKGWYDKTKAHNVAYRAVRDKKGSVGVSSSSTTIDSRSGIKGFVDEKKETFNDWVGNKISNPHVKEFVTDRLPKSQQQESERQSRRGGFKPDKR